MGGRSPRRFPISRLFFASLSVTTLVVACGGEVQSGPLEEPTDEPTTTDPKPEPTSSSTPGGGGGGGGKSNAPEVDLPGCKLGEKQTGDADQKCVYLYEGRCYSQKLEACACACKKQSGTTCSSGFPDPDVPTEVSCS